MGGRRRGRLESFRRAVVMICEILEWELDVGVASGGCFVG